MSTPVPISTTQVLDTNWMKDAACRRMPDLPWTTDRDRAPVVLWDLMASVCEVCPVKAQCAAFVADADVTGGYWAGRNRASANPDEVEARWVAVDAHWEQGVLPLDGVA